MTKLLTLIVTLLFAMPVKGSSAKAVRVKVPKGQRMWLDVNRLSAFQLAAG